MDYRIILITGIEALLLAVLAVKICRFRDLTTIALGFALIIAAVMARLLVFDYRTLDYENFLSQWVEYFRQYGGFKALNRSVGNYNIPYLYFLAAFSYLDISDLHLIKLLSVSADVLLALSSGLLAAYFTGNPWKRFCTFLGVLILPTVFLNGAVWGQCDSLYTAFLILGIYLALDDFPVCSIISFTVAFAFKLQAVFVLPVIFILLLYRRIRLLDCLAAPLTYILIVLPAVVAGRPFWETITLYFNQTGSIGSGLNYNSSSLFAILDNPADAAMASKLAIASAFLFMLVVILFCVTFRPEITSNTVLAAAVLFAVGIPFLLPHMHDRYFFAADILTFILGIVYLPLLPAALLTQFASLLGYHAYLKMRYLLPMRYGAFALILVLAAEAVYFIFSFKNKKKSS